jgi:hypothetical protein
VIGIVAVIRYKKKEYDGLIKKKIMENVIKIRSI